MANYNQNQTQNQKRGDPVITNPMPIAVFAKKRTTSEGRVFFTYLTTLTRKDNSTFTVQVRFRGDDDNKPDARRCPMNIIIERSTANLSKRIVVNSDGEAFDSFTLWVNDWIEGDPYVDHSLDDVF